MDWLTHHFELDRGEAHNLRAIEGVRGFAVLLVFLVHYVSLAGPWIDGGSPVQGVANALHVAGNAGVHLFFVLSGYLIYGSLIARAQPFLPFIARRAERIYPAFAVVFLVYVALSFAFPAQSRIPGAPLAAGIYLAENFLLLPGIFPIQPMIAVAWSLSYELLFYLAIPLLIAVLGLRTRSAAWRVTLFSVLAAATALCCAIAGGPVWLVMFIAGILVHEAIASGVPAPHGAIGTLALVAGIAALLLPWAGDAGMAAKAALVFGCFLVFGLACFRGPGARLPRAFAWTPLRWLGNASYSYFLAHGIALNAAFVALALVLPSGGYGAWLFWLMLPIMFCVTLVPAAALFLWVERPLSLSPSRRRLRRAAAAA